MAFVTPQPGTAGQVYTAAAHNVLVDNFVELAPFFSAWTSWTPTYTNLTIGNGTVVSTYLQVGKLVHFYWRFTVGSTSSSAVNMRVSLPVNVKNFGHVWRGHYRVPASGTFGIAGENLADETAHNFRLRSVSSGQFGDLSLPASNSIVVIEGSYEAA